MRRAHVLLCPRGHSFDVARSGYCNLLQPQDRHSSDPGDSREAAQARRRWTDRGHERELVGEVLAELDAVPAASRRTVLDIGCGDGALLGSVASLRTVEAHGVDISAPAIRLAARRYKGPTWIVANADRVLPFPDASFDLVTSIVSRRNAGEIRRVLSPAGRAVIVVPGEEDVIELREAVLGRGERRDRSAKAIEAMAPQLELVTRRAWKRRTPLDSAGVRDLLATTYRGARYSQRQRAAAIGPLDVTLHRELLVFRRRKG